MIQLQNVFRKKIGFKNDFGMIIFLLNGLSACVRQQNEVIEWSSSYKATTQRRWKLLSGAPYNDEQKVPTAAPCDTTSVFICVLHNRSPVRLALFSMGELRH